MNLSTIKAIAVAAAFVASGAGAAAENYFVGPEANVAAGTKITYKNVDFIVGQTAFTGIWSALGVYQENSKIYFSANTIGSFTINKPNVELIGANAWCDAWSGQRNEAETKITGTITVNASNVTVNGFCFSGNGCVRNDAAGRGSTCLSGFRYIYNKCTGSTLAGATNVALCYLGDAWRPAQTDANKQDPTKWAAIERYHDVYIGHNLFEGAQAENQPMAIQVAGSSEGTVITDNRFIGGGTAVSLFNTQNNFEISHNRFTNVGVGTANGEFCVRLFYLGCNSATGQFASGNIRHNVFDGCTGQSTMWTLIRFFNGDKNETIVNPVNTTVNVNYNTFLNKTCKRTDGYNYVFYANNTNTTTANVDVRWNCSDNTEYCFAWVKPAWETAGQRYFAGSQNRFNYEGSHGTTVDFYGKKDENGNAEFGRVTPTGGAGGMKGWWFGKSSVKGADIATVVQSMDIDDATGDCYFINAKYARSNGSLGAWGSAVSKAFPSLPMSDDMLIMTRVAMGGAETHMYLTYGGHGSNMAVTRYKGKVWIATGGYGTTTSTSPTKICLFPWSAGKALDLRDGSYVKYLKVGYSGNMCYPAIDNDNRLFMVRSRSSSGDYFAVYDLDKVMASPETAEPIKEVFVAKGARKISNSSRKFLNSNDKGFKTWSDQGFTISGDYIYTYEGDGKDGYGSNPNPSTATDHDSKSVLIVNVINWRTGEYVQRSAILNSKVWTNMCSATDDSGEPESMKIHRDATGRPFMAVGVVTGAGGARRFNMFAYKLKQSAGVGDALSIDPHGFTANKNSLSFSSMGESQTQSVSVTLSGHAKDVHAAIVGADGGSFSVSKNGTACSVIFTPDRWKNNYSAFLRLSSPNCKDVMIPLTGKYTGTLSGVEDLTDDSFGNGGLDDEQPVRYYDLNGHQLSQPVRGVNIVRRPDGTTGKVIMR